jgi:hypothetical protein
MSIFFQQRSFLTSPLGDLFLLKQELQDLMAKKEVENSRWPETNRR